MSTATDGGAEYGRYADSTAPASILVWDIKHEGCLTKFVFHVGSTKSIKNLRRRKHLPSYDEVLAARTQPGAAP